MGGAVPALLVDEVPPGLPAYAGTAGVQRALQVLDDEEPWYYDGIADGLRSLGLRPGVQNQDGQDAGWRWTGRHRASWVQVDFYCPARTLPGRPGAPAAAAPAETALGPITALVAGLGSLVPADAIAVRRRVQTSYGWLTYEFPVAGITSWLCLQSDAIMRRPKPEDAYDVVWTTDALGPDQMAGMIAASPLLADGPAADVVAQLRLLVSEQFGDPESAGPALYAEFLEADVFEEQPREAALWHARGAIAALGEALRSRGVI